MKNGQAIWWGYNYSSSNKKERDLFFISTKIKQIEENPSNYGPAVNIIWGTNFYGEKKEMEKEASIELFDWNNIAHQLESKGNLYAKKMGLQNGKHPLIGCKANLVGCAAFLRL